MLYVRFTAVLGLAALLAAASPAAQQVKTRFDGTSVTAEKKFEARVFKNAQGEQLPYRFLKPLGADPAKAYPLILFLHGAGERGSDNTRTCKHALPAFSSTAIMKKYPCYVIAPQVPEGQKWVNVDWSALVTKAPAEPSQSLRLALELLASIQKEYKIDAQRIYVTGVSMGGYGTWDAITRHPELFAAAVPICGGGDPAKASAIAQKPIWVFHGDADRAVPVAKSREMVAALKQAGSKAKYTEYPGVQHDCWTRTYTTPALYKWLFAQKLK